MGYLYGFIAIAVIVIIIKFNSRRVTIFEYERGLKYSKGKFSKILEPGQYWYFPYFDSVIKVDIRPNFISIPGQEVLSSDGVTLKVSLAANYEITDPNTAINTVQSSSGSMYLELQLALRNIIGLRDIDTILEHKEEISKALFEQTHEKIAALGLNLISVDVKDIMFPGKLKEIFSQVVSARKEGQAALERARGETAALRNLANAAKMLDDNPNLMQLRALQTMGESSGNTLVFGVSPQSINVPVKNKANDK
ncbi:MAG: slipin family protein [Sedimentisphaerales bacterium]|nr:slipin family protein [Sedimentisphaerales bacterium]